jgi:Domain of unknown function (DUF4331)
MKIKPRALALSAALYTLTLAPGGVMASSHMDAPLITLDPAANTTDVYAFVSSRNGVKYLTTALAVYPFEEPGIGPNKYNFDDNVLYQIHVAMGPDIAKGKPTFSYEFQFNTTFKNQDTFAPSFIDVINKVDDAGQNLTQRYSVTKVTANGYKRTVLFQNAVVPPNNQGLVTPFYNQGDNGENLAKEGVASPDLLDRYTQDTIFSNPLGYVVFAGQRDDGFYADVQSVFDLDPTFSGPNKPFDSQGGFNVHTIVLNIPIAELGGDQQSVGVWATTSRRAITVLRTDKEPIRVIPWVQVGRQGNPLFCELFVAQKDKDKFNRQSPDRDQFDFQTYALNPQLAAVVGAPAGLRTNRTDLASIFIPDLIKVDLSTGPARLAGGNNPGGAPDDSGFNRLGIFGNDVLQSQIQDPFGNGGLIPGGWPNGRRFGDDVVDIGLIAILSDLRGSKPMIFTGSNNLDRVTSNDIGYNKVFPYAATPHNGRNHTHH